MDVLTFSPSQPPLRLVTGRLGEDGRVSEVDAGVEVQVGPGRDLVAGQDEVLLTVARHLGTVRPQPTISVLTVCLQSPLSSLQSSPECLLHESLEVGSGGQCVGRHGLPLGGEMLDDLLVDFLLDLRPGG